MIFKLSKTIEFSRDGDFVKTATINFSEPTIEAYEESMELTEKITLAIFDASTIAAANVDTEKMKKDDAKKDDATSNMDMKALRMMILASNRVKWLDIVDICKRLFSKVGTYEGKTPLNDSLFRNVNPNDITEMIFFYIENFIKPSLD